MSNALSLGRTFFGLAAAASGVLQIVTGEFVRLVPKGSAAAASATPSLWPYVVGVVLIAAGIGILASRTARLGAGVVAGLILLSLAFRQVPRALSNPWAGFMWTNPLKALALVGGGAIVAATWSPRQDGLSPGPLNGRVERLSVAFLAIFLVVCGLQHFAYADFVTTMVPAWMPGRRFWTYFTGVALIAGGAGILVPPTVKLAAMLSGVMIFLWVLMLHIPRAVSGPNNANETAGVFEALAISGIALMVAGRWGQPRPDDA